MQLFPMPLPRLILYIWFSPWLKATGEQQKFNLLKPVKYYLRKRNHPRRKEQAIQSRPFLQISQKLLTSLTVAD